MDEENMRTELLGLERRYWQGIKDRDIETCLSLTDDPCIVAGSQGFMRVNKETFRKIMESATYTLHSFKIDDDAELHLLSPDIAVLAYDVHEDLTVDGKAVSLDATETSVWVRKGGRWLCSLHTESTRGDPYGRDRIPDQRAEAA
jgi:ketosteroid isomerase-like protein